jgi:molecular chaperone HtpG
VLCFTDDVDEFAIQMLMEYDGKHFANICKDELIFLPRKRRRNLRKRTPPQRICLMK